MAQSPGAQPNLDSLNHYLQLVEQGEQQTGNALASIGYLYRDVGRYNTALSYFDQALPLLNGEGRSRSLAKIYQSKGAIYEIFGDNAEPRRYYRLAQIQFQRASEIFESLGNATDLLAVHQNLAGIAAKRRNFAEAVFYQNQVITALSELYKDSLQQQAESFNELLNQEIQSSKDTILISVPQRTGSGANSLPLTNWRHIALVLLGLAFLTMVYSWISERRKLSEVRGEIERTKATQKRLFAQTEELQKINLTLSKTEKDQRHLNQTKDKIFSIISHDLRSPINTISGFLNILGAKLSSIGDIEMKALAHDMEESTGRLSRFLDDLLKWSMSQMGQLKPHPEKIDLMELVKENYLLMESRLKQKNIHFKTDIPDNIRILADMNMINLVIRNLVSNAIKFTRQGGLIKVSLSAEVDNTARLEIADDGIGISEDNLQRLFEFEARNLDDRVENGGAGLGLILCKEFVELNSGTISVESKLGEGTRFIIHLPSIHLS